MRDLLKISARYGLIGSALIVIMFLVFYFSDENPINDLWIFQAGTYLIFILFCCLEYRNQYNSRKLEYWKGMTIGAVIFLINTIVFICFFLVLISLDTELINSKIAIDLENLEEQRTTYVEKLGAETYISVYESTKNTTPQTVVKDILIKSVFIGVIVSSFLSFIFLLIEKLSKK